MQNLEELYNEYFQMVFKYLFSLTQNTDLSEELTQETFYQAMKIYDKFRGDSKVSVWLCQIAKHLWYREYKRMRGGNSKSIEEISDNLPSNENIGRDIVASESKVELFQMIQTYTHPGHLADDRITESIKFQVVNQQFMEIYSLEEIENIFESSVDIAYHDSRLSETSLYDENGNDVTEEFLIKNNLDGPKGSIGKAELFLLNVYIGIILVIGFTITRYYLTD